MHFVYYKVLLGAINNIVIVTFLQKMSMILLSFFTKTYLKLVLKNLTKLKQKVYFILKVYLN